MIGTFTFFPFGKQAVNRKTMTGQSDIGTGTLGLIGNILWFVLIGVWLAIGHIASALACFVTIIGIPFGIQHLKLALISLAPIGQMIVTNQRRNRAAISAKHGKCAGRRCPATKKRAD